MEEYLTEGSPDDGPLIRLYDFTAMEAAQLHASLSALASETRALVEVHQLPFVEAVGECRLTLVRRDWDQAVTRVARVQFECGFTAGTWGNVVGLIEPFTRTAAGFQWLAGSPGEAAILLSPSGEW
jgi:hypothetical protein